MFLTEILNLIFYFLLNLCFSFYISKATPTKDIYIYIYKDVTIEIILMLFSLLIYYFISKKIFVNFGDSKIQKYSAIITAILVIISYPVSELITQITGEYFIIHMQICSPIAYLIAMPFSTSTINHLYEIILMLFSPVSILLIWLFSKIGNRKKKQGTVL